MKTADDLMTLVADHYGVTVEDMKSERRFRSLTDARTAFVNIMITKSLTRHSYDNIGKMINRDHSSVCHMVKKHRNYMDTDMLYKQKYNSLDISGESSFLSRDTILNEIRVLQERITTLENML